MPQLSPPATRIKTGRYTGDGTTSHAIRGVGFRPKYVHIEPLVDSEGGHELFYKTAEHDADMCVFQSGTMVYKYDNRIISLDADGFTVSDDGNNSHPNMDGRVYSYVALG